MSPDEYAAFIESKTQLGDGKGFEPIEVPDFLFPFQRSLVEWSIRQGRAALYEDCGLGKSIQALVWADNVIRKTNGKVLILTPLAVAPQFVKEGSKFGIGVEHSRTGKFEDSNRIIVTNYQQLDKFSPGDFQGCICDESSILKNFKGKIKAAITEFMRTLPYRLLCTATPAPNDFEELGTSAECLGEMGYQDMITKFFKQAKQNKHAGWGRPKYHLRGHGERDFWRWVCSWARAVRKPSDLGFDDGPFTLPRLIQREHTVEASRKRDGFLFDLPARTVQEQAEERRRTIVERCEKVAELVASHPGHSLVWAHLNPEGDLLEKLIPGSVQVSGNDPDEKKEEAVEWFIGADDGSKRILISKPVIFGYGLNLQCSNHQVFFPSHSFEQTYQALRRSLRFGQENEVTMDVVTTEGEIGVMENYRRKAEQAEQMFDMLVRLMNDQLHLQRRNPFTKKAEMPAWL